tara:strand:+ start:1148 stop:1786 length:639 start_codon:yes stop_codon:yes gene_type:complete
MQQLGIAPEKDQAKVFFNHLKIDASEFSEVDQGAVLSTFYRLLESEDIGSPPEQIKYNRQTYFSPKDLLDMPVKFLVELVNVDLDHENFSFYYAIPALLYRKDWSKNFSKDEYIEGQQLFHTAPFIFSLWAVKLFNQLIVTLQDNYPVLYKGESDDDSASADGRKMYGLLKILANKDATKMEAAERMEIWRAFTWVEQEKIDEINLKNAKSN